MKTTAFLEPVDALVLAVHETTRPLIDRDPCGLPERMRRAAVAAAELLLRGGEPPLQVRLEQLARVRSLLRELGYYIDLAERLDLLDAAGALELLELDLRANVDLTARIEGLLASGGESGVRVQEEAFEIALGA